MVCPEEPPEIHSFEETTTDKIYRFAVFFSPAIAQILLGEQNYGMLSFYVLGEDLYNNV